MWPPLASARFRRTRFLLREPKVPRVRFRVIDGLRASGLGLGSRGLPQVPAPRSSGRSLGGPSGGRCFASPGWGGGSPDRWSGRSCAMVRAFQLFYLECSWAVVRMDPGRRLHLWVYFPPGPVLRSVLRLGPADNGGLRWETAKVRGNPDESDRHCGQKTKETRLMRTRCWRRGASCWEGPGATFDPFVLRSFGPPA